jgi:cytoplasmic iron level regulating protein YaaA (DUF328/UPF0246 family)
VSDNYKIILSPAKNLNEEPSRCEADLTLPAFLAQAQVLVNTLKKKNEEELGQLMKISPKLAQQNISRFHSWKTSKGNEEELIAIQAFSGEVFRAFDFKSISKSSYNELSNKLRILSGLYGVLRPFDLIYPYRLEMGTAMRVDNRFKNLYEFWSDPLAKYFKEFLGDSILINLASNEYSKSIQLNKLGNKVITPVFKEFRNGKFQSIMMYAKHARGKMAKFLIENSLKSTEELKFYNVDGYIYHNDLSTDTNWVFTR